jgi:SAM-dependent methyltransferase
MDITSGIAVYALELSPTDQVLDLCCAPGAKLCLIAEQLANTSPSSTKGIGTVTGVDISSHRIATCRSLLRKYPAPGLPRVRLFKADGTTFSVYAPSRVGPHWTRPNLEQILATNQTANTKSTTILKPFHAPKTLRHDPQLVHPALLYDKVNSSIQKVYKISHSLHCD